MGCDVYRDLVTWSGSLAFPEWAKDASSFFYVRKAGGETTLQHQDIASGYSCPINPAVSPSASVGYGGHPFAVGTSKVFVCGKDRGVYSVGIADGVVTCIVPPLFSGVARPVLSKCEGYILFCAEWRGHCNIYCVDVDGRQLPRKLSQDPWFAYNPVISDCGTWVVWQQWRQGVMSWDESSLHTLCFELSLAKAQSIPDWEYGPIIAASGVSITQPQFRPGSSTDLAYLSDLSGFRSLYLRNLAGNQDQVLYSGRGGELGGADWVAGQSQYGWQDTETLVVLQTYQAKQQLLQIHLNSKQVSQLPLDFGLIDHFSVCDTAVLVLGSSPKAPERICSLDFGDDIATARSTLSPRLDIAIEPEFLQWRSKDGLELSGIFYRATEGKAKRPLIINLHGGPSTCARFAWNPNALFFSKIGYHYLDLNYRGSTGFGRAFLDALKGSWGLKDVSDARSAAEHLLSLGLARKDALVVMGSSAGGYTTLQALITDPEFWAAGISSYGIADLYDLERGCPRFEQGYSPSLVGPLPAAAKLWRDRSPVVGAHRIIRPLLLLHGKKDQVVPYQHSERIHTLLVAKNIPCELLLLADEGHGFSSADSKAEALSAKETFLHRYVICKQ